MGFFRRVTLMALAAGFGVGTMADNPISSYHYLADPAAAADDEYFYVITDSDDPAAADAKDYAIYALYAFRSKDMKNWTDLGVIYDARKVDGIGAIWASGIAVRNGTFYIVFPDGGGGGIGYIKAPAIEGPWTNAVNGKSKLINNYGSGLINCDDTPWCFDPGIFVDDDGTAYVTWGGGDNNTRGNTDNFDIVKLNSSMDGVVGTGSHVKVNNLPTRKMLEASYIHKYKGNYYFSYSTGWQSGAPSIDYAMSTNVMGPYTWKGTILEDPSINGKSINGNNNHHGIAEFKGHWYTVYHDRRIANGYNGLEVIPADDGRANPNAGYHRSVSLDEMYYNADGTIKKVVCTNDGPEQIENFNPYDTYPALTSSKQKGIRSRSNFVQGKAAETYLLPLSSRAESWIRVSGVDFGTKAKTFVVNAASTASDNKIEIRSGSASGTLAGTCTLAKTSNKSSFTETECEVSGLSGIVDELYLVFKGAQDSTMAILEWGFTGEGGTTIATNTPYDGVAAEIPGKIEAEKYDLGGRKAYKDNTAENEGDANFRMDEGVDIVKGGTGMAVGYTQINEWMKYTVNVTETATYKISANVASGSTTSSFLVYVDDKVVGDTVKVPQTDETTWDVYKDIEIDTAELTAGEHVVKILITGDYVNIDYIEILDPNKTGIANSLKFSEYNAEMQYDVFDLKGQHVTSVMATSMDVSDLVRKTMQRSGVYLVRGKSNGFAKRIQVTK